MGITKLYVTIVCLILNQRFNLIITCVDYDDGSLVIVCSFNICQKSIDSINI